jgi:hypothetical protein
MKKLNNKQSQKDILKSTSKDKANTVFLKLLAKQKSKRRDWSDVRAETYPITKEIKPGADDV